MKLSRLFFFTAKNYLKKTFFVIALLLLPLLGILLSSRLSGKEAEKIRVALFVTASDSKSEDASWLIDTLLNNEYSFEFYESESEEGLLNDVLTGDAECGYLIPDDIYELLKDNESDGSVTVVTGSKSTMVAVVNETVYSALFERLSRTMLLNYLTKYSVVKEDYQELFTREDVYALHNKYMNNAATFHVNYENKPEEFLADKTSILLSPLRGLFAVLVLCSGFIGALSYYRAAKHPVFALFRVRLVQILIPMLFSGIVVLASLFLFPDLPDVDHSFSGLIAEAASLLLYILISLIFLLLLTTLIRSERLFYAVFPLYLLGCLIFSPIFIDIGQYVPLFRIVSRLFLPAWYL